MADTLLIYGRTESGKTAQVGILAEHVRKTTNKKTRLATADRGGTKTVKPYIDLGIIEVVELGTSEPWIWLSKVVRGYIRDGNGKWILDQKRNAEIGLWAFESFRSIAETLMNDLSKRAALGGNTGGGTNVSFRVTGDGESLQVVTDNTTHYRVVQGRMTEEIWESQRLPGQYIMWTSSVSKDDDPTSSGKVLGPDVIGRALTAETPRWFHYTMRIDGFPAIGGKPGRHVLYLGSHQDINAGNTPAVGNTRRPLDSPPLPSLSIEPADVVKALDLLSKGSDEATEVVRKRLGL